LLPEGVPLAGGDHTPLRRSDDVLATRPIHHYFGYQAQAVHIGKWMLFS